MFKDKRVLIAIVVVVVLLVLGGGYMVLSSHKAASTDQTATQDDGSIPTLSSSDLGLTMQASPDKKQVKFTIDKASDIKSIDYDLTYDADVTAEEKAEGNDQDTVTRDIHNENQKPTNGKYESKWHDLGSCSSGTCKYDTGVTSVKLQLKITKTDGKVYQANDSISL